MSFEEEQMDKALKALEETEKKCEVGDGFVKSIKKKFSKKKKKEVRKMQSVKFTLDKVNVRSKSHWCK